MRKHRFKKLTLNHKTYHHFLGGGLFDSEIDVILYSEDANETLEKIICQNDNPMIDSHHDLIVSSIDLPTDLKTNNTAPRIENKRLKILWSEQNLLQYRTVLGDNLPDLFDRWGDSPTTSSMSILLSST